MADKNVEGIVNELTSTTPIYNKEEQEARKKNKQRWIGEDSNHPMYPGKTVYFIDGDPLKYVRWFGDYPSAHNYLNEVESREESRRKKMLDDYYGGQGDLEQLHSRILSEFNGNIKAAFEWLLKNARR